MDIYLLSKNSGKIAAANSVFNQYHITVKSISEEFPEIQANSSAEIAKFTVLEAVQKLQLPVIREDHSLYIHALGIPGPYTAFIEKTLPATKLLEILALHPDRTGHFEISAAYADPSGTLKEYSYTVPIHFKIQEVVPDPRGGWSGLMCLEGETRAFTEYPEEDRLSVWNKNYIEIAKYLTQAQV